MDILIKSCVLSEQWKAVKKCFLNAKKKNKIFFHSIELN